MTPGDAVVPRRTIQMWHTTEEGYDPTTQTFANECVALWFPHDIAMIVAMASPIRWVLVLTYSGVLGWVYDANSIVIANV